MPRPPNDAHRRPKLRARAVEHITSSTTSRTGQKRTATAESTRAVASGQAITGVAA